jgi:hypothetical protein
MKTPPPITPNAIEALCANRRKNSGRGGILSRTASLDAMPAALLLNAIEISDFALRLAASTIITSGAVALNLI